MKKTIFFILCLFLIPAYACEKYIIGIRGLGNLFDQESFLKYVNHNNGCYEVFNWDEQKKAINFINTLNQDYVLYGFSKGAESITEIVPKLNNQPIKIITVGAWKTINLNFSNYKFEVENYFDSSGVGQKSKGVFIKNVPHMKMQKYVNDNYLLKN